MSDTVYLVRLRRAFCSRYEENTGKSVDVTDPNIRIFQTFEKAEEFAIAVAPPHSPFGIDAIEWDIQESPFGIVTAEQMLGAESATFEVYRQADETNWEYYLSSDGRHIASENNEEEEDFEDQGTADRTVQEVELVTAIQNVGLPARTTETWQDWWETNAPTITDAQRVAFWRVFTDNPYLIIALPAEL